MDTFNYNKGLLAVAFITYQQGLEAIKKKKISPANTSKSDTEKTRTNSKIKQ